MAAEIVPLKFPEEMLTEEPVTNDVKSQAAADKFRIQADELYEKRRLVKALELYNRSLCCSVPGSAGMGLVYSSRARFYHDARMYTRSIENVQLARQCELNAEQRTKLGKREELCQEALRNNEEYDIRNNFYKLSRKAHPMYPMIVDCLEIRENAQWGRHVITTKNLKVGEVICLEEPFIAAPKADRYLLRCSYCLKSNNFSLIPCPKCTSVMYCSSACMDNDASHPYHCGVQGLPDLYTQTLRTLFRSLKVFGNTSELYEHLHPDRMIKRRVTDFNLSDPSAPDYERNLMLCLHSLAKNGDIEARRELMEKHGDKILETEPLRSEKRTGDENAFLNEFVAGLSVIHDTNSYEVREYTQRGNDFPVGAAIYPFASLLSHSCVPNVKRFTVDNKIAIVAAVPIKAGEQIFVSYGFGAFRVTKAGRQREMKRYNFECNCVACSNPDEYPRLNWMECRVRHESPPKFNAPYTYHEAFFQYGVNCEYIKRHLDSQPSFEITATVEFNVHMCDRMARDPIYDAEEAIKVVKPRNYLD